jgi:hypothetical protein
VATESPVTAIVKEHGTIAPISQGSAQALAELESASQKAKGPHDEQGVGPRSQNAKVEIPDGTDLPALRQ